MTDQIFSSYLGNWPTANCSFNLVSALEGKDILLGKASLDSMGFVLRGIKEDMRGKHFF